MHFFYNHTLPFLAYGWSRGYNQTCSNYIGKVEIESVGNQSQTAQGRILTVDAELENV